ncbi:glycosyl hydrolase family 59 protein [Nitzschia inconspicua]|uniref:Glycosyl hydrolase family 59 protein n=1 Tax=Nitzschia inconspicua TaxID=303405 RepID=A0A9K3LG07_9STRA|nr:glycosyl hydrolase family 59 protein [Nitzschia inconspicua]
MPIDAEEVAQQFSCAFVHRHYFQVFLLLVFSFTLLLDQQTRRHGCSYHHPLHHQQDISFDILQQSQRGDLRYFDGHGGLSAGGSSRLLIDYPEPQRSEILDYLFLPQFGASTAVLKVEIGGDAQSTVGTEPSHQHERGNVDCRAGYEGWLTQEARKRNPNIIIWSLSWGLPGWIGNETHEYYNDENIDYQIGWVQCLKNEYHVESNYIGLWNERPQGSVEYVTKLRKALDQSGFKTVGITVEATWQKLIDQALDDSDFNQSIVAATMHYPCNKTCPSALKANKKVWAGEDTPTPFQNWTAASCWGRKLNQHFLKLNMTSAVSWAIVWSTLEGISVPIKVGEANHQFRGNAFLTAEQPWSGHYTVNPTLWVQAHWGQFVQPGWRFLHAGNGSNFLPKGGSYVTLVPPLDDATFPENDFVFTMIIETLHGSCGGHPVECDVPKIEATQQLTFRLGSFQHSLSMSKPTVLNVWCSNATRVFINQPKIPIHESDGSFSLTMPPDTICTISTALNVGHRGEHPEPPKSLIPFPTVYRTNFDSTSNGHDLAWGFSDVYGSFAIRNGSFTQVATALPIRITMYEFVAGVEILAIVESFLTAQHRCASRYQGVTNGALEINPVLYRILKTRGTG